MSMNDPGTNPQWPQQPPPKTGMKGSTKVLIGLAIAFGVLCVLCCGIVGGAVYYFRNAASQDPQKVRQVTESMVQMDIPDEFKPAMSIDVKMFMTMVVWGDFGNPNEQNELVIAISPMVTQANPAQAQEQLEQSLRQQGKGKRPLVDRKSETDRSRSAERKPIFSSRTGKMPPPRPRGWKSRRVRWRKGMTMLVVQTDPKNEEKIAR